MRPRQRGFFAALSLGWGMLDYGGLPSGGIRHEAGVGGFLPRVGYRFGPTVAVAAQVHLWKRFGDETQYSGLQAMVLLAPARTRGLRFAVGIGLDEVEERPGVERDSGLGVSVYGIYDLRLARWLALSPYLALQHGWLEAADVRLLSAGLGLTFW